jgi:ABC-2 type transport system permease protein
VAEPLVLTRRYVDISWLWVRAAWVYRASFLTLVVANGLITGLDAVALWITFTHLDLLGGFSLHEVALLYGASSLGLGIADTLIGSVELVGEYVRTGRLDQMLTKPLPLLLQVCADQFTLRRLGRITQAGLVFAWAATYVDWTSGRVAVAVMMIGSGGALFFGLFVMFSCIQFWTHDATEFANAFTYGGSYLSSFPFSVFGTFIRRFFVFVVPVAFVAYLPSLALLGRDDPMGLPGWLSWCGVPVALLASAAALGLWRAGLRHYVGAGS